MPEKKKILIVDDDEEICEEMSEILAAEGYEVAARYNGLEGRKCLEQGGYDLALLDLKMPGMSGYDLLKAMKNLHVHAKFLVVSGRPFIKKYLPGEDKSEKQQKEDILKLADGFINKPFDVAVVLAKIKELLQ